MREIVAEAVCLRTRAIFTRSIFVSLRQINEPASRGAYDFRVRKGQKMKSIVDLIMPRLLVVVLMVMMASVLGAVMVARPAPGISGNRPDGLLAQPFRPF